jgi:hypothetical protein
VENQHRLIAGYRDLSQEEIDLINEIKAQSIPAHFLYEQVRTLLEKQSMNPPTDWAVTEPMRWLAIFKTHHQEGQSALVRAVAQPTGF